MPTDNKAQESTPGGSGVVAVPSGQRGDLQCASEVTIAVEQTDEARSKVDARVKPAREDDWSTEYLDAIVAVKVVEGEKDGSRVRHTFNLLDYYNPETETMWLFATGKLLQVPLNPDRWIEKACEVVGDGFTQDEWDRYVPGDEPLTSACN